jgi:hypothetical protein
MLGLGAEVRSASTAVFGSGSDAAGLLSVLVEIGIESLGVVLRELIGWLGILLLLVRLVMTRGTSISSALAVSMGRLVLECEEEEGFVSFLADC